MSRRLLAVGSAIGLLLPLAACGGDDPDTKPSTSASASASSSPSQPPTESAAPSPPPEAEANTKAAAIAFVKHYVELLNYAQRTGNTSVLRQASDPACSTCNTAMKAVNDIYSKGGTVEGGEWRITKIIADPTTAYANGWVTLSRVVTTKQTIRLPGKPPDQRRGGKTSQSILVSPSAQGEWKVRTWSRAD